MHQTALIKIAMERKRFPSGTAMAAALGIPQDRMSRLRAGARPLDASELLMVAEWAGVPAAAALAACALDRETNHAKRAFLQSVAGPVLARLEP